MYGRTKPHEGPKIQMFETLQGIIDPILQKLAKCAKDDDDKNICQKLHTLLAKPGFSLQVAISHATINIKHARRRKVMEAAWPVLKLSSWLEYIMQEQGGQLLLAGHHISQSHLWKQDLQEFWARYRAIDPTHPVYCSDTLERDHCYTIPFLLHGDEGRGRTKQPVLVISFQGVMSHHGKEKSNISGCLGLTYHKISCGALMA